MLAVLITIIFNGFHLRTMSIEQQNFAALAEKRDGLKIEISHPSNQIFYDCQSLMLLQENWPQSDLFFEKKLL